MSECIFCKIANGEIPSNTIFEDDNFRVILDLAPANIGHSLVLPKVHARDIFELDCNIVGDAHKIAKKVAMALKDSYGFEGVNILQNNGEIAGQSVSHYHVHVIPRVQGDKVSIFSESVNLSSEDFEEIRAKIKRNM